MIKVASYCRVSTDKDDQANSFEAQQRYFMEYIDRRPDWELYEVYADDTTIMGLNRNQRQSDGCLVPFFLFSEDFSNQMRMYQF